MKISPGLVALGAAGVAAFILFRPKAAAAVPARTGLFDGVSQFGDWLGRSADDVGAWAVRVDDAAGVVAKKADPFHVGRDLGTWAASNDVPMTNDPFAIGQAIGRWLFGAPVNPAVQAGYNWGPGEGW